MYPVPIIHSWIPGQPRIIATIEDDDAAGIVFTTTILTLDEFAFENGYPNVSTIGITLAALPKLPIQITATPVETVVVGGIQWEYEVSTDGLSYSTSPISFAFSTSVRVLTSTQMLYIRAIDDKKDDELSTNTLNFAVTQGDGSGYAPSLEISTITIYILDNERPGFTFTTFTTTVVEGSTQQVWLGVALTSQPNDEIILRATYTTSGRSTSEFTIDPAEFTFTAANALDANEEFATQAFRVIAVDDFIDESTETVFLSMSVVATSPTADPNYHNRGDEFNWSTVAVTILDNDEAGINIRVVSSTNHAGEDKQVFAEYGITLTSQPESTVTLSFVEGEITPAIGYLPTHIGEGFLIGASTHTVGEAPNHQLTIEPWPSPQWNTTQIVWIGSDDDFYDDATQTQIILVNSTIDDVTIDPMWSGDKQRVSTAVVQLIDDDTAGFVSSIHSTDLRVMEPDSVSTFGISLTAQPFEAVEVVLSRLVSYTTLSNGVTTEVRFIGAGTAFTFDNSLSNWRTTQVVTIQSVDDFIDDDTQTFSIELATTATYGTPDFANTTDSQLVGSLSLDDDTALVLLTASSPVEVIDNGLFANNGKDTLEVRLQTQPVSTVVLTFTGSTGNKTNAGLFPEHTLVVFSTATSDIQESNSSAQIRVLFTAEDWNTTQTIALIGPYERDANSTLNFTITISSAESSDTKYKALADQTVPGLNINDDFPEFKIDGITNGDRLVEGIDSTYRIYVEVLPANGDVALYLDLAITTASVLAPNASTSVIDVDWEMSTDGVTYSTATFIPFPRNDIVAVVLPGETTPINIIQRFVRLTYNDDDVFVSSLNLTISYESIEQNTTAGTVNSYTSDPAPGLSSGTQVVLVDDEALNGIALSLFTPADSYELPDPAQNSQSREIVWRARFVKALDDQVVITNHTGENIPVDLQHVVETVEQGVAEVGGTTATGSLDFDISTTTLWMVNERIESTTTWVVFDDPAFEGYPRHERLKATIQYIEADWAGIIGHSRSTATAKIIDNEAEEGVVEALLVGDFGAETLPTEPAREIEFIYSLASTNYTNAVIERTVHVRAFEQDENNFSRVGFSGVGTATASVAGDGTPNNPFDFFETVHTVQIAHGHSTAQITVTVNDDELIESTETVTAALDGLFDHGVSETVPIRSADGAIAYATNVIQDNDRAIGQIVRANRATNVFEDDGRFRMRVFIDGLNSLGYALKYVVNFDLSSSTLISDFGTGLDDTDNATNAADFKLPPVGTAVGELPLYELDPNPSELRREVAIPVGDREVFFEIQLVDDVLIEGIENLQFSLSMHADPNISTSDVSVDETPANVIVFDDELNKGLEVVVGNLVNGSETGPSSASFTIGFRNTQGLMTYNALGTTLNVVMDYAGEAQQGDDYVGSQSIPIASIPKGTQDASAHARETTYQLAVIDDDLFENSESLQVNAIRLFADDPAQVSPQDLDRFSFDPSFSTGQLAIRDNDNTNLSLVLEVVKPGNELNQSFVTDNVELIATIQDSSGNRVANNTHGPLRIELSSTGTDAPIGELGDAATLGEASNPNADYYINQQDQRRHTNTYQLDHSQEIATITLTVINDNRLESRFEWLSADVQSAQTDDAQETFSTLSSIVTYIDDDEARAGIDVSLAISSSTIIEGGEATTLIVNLENKNSFDNATAVITMDSAISSADIDDLTLGNQPLTTTTLFVPLLINQTSGTIDLSAITDNRLEIDERVQFEITAIQVSTASLASTFVILPSEKRASLTIADQQSQRLILHVTSTPGEEGEITNDGDQSTAAIVIVELTDTSGDTVVNGLPNELDIAFEYRTTTEHRAVAGKDYSADPLVVSIQPGEQRSSATIQILYDQLFENTETISFHTQSVGDIAGSNFLPINSTQPFSVAIIDDDNAPGSIVVEVIEVKPGFEAPSAQHRPVEVIIQMEKINHTGVPLQIGLIAQDGSALIGTDFIDTTQVTIEDGQRLTTASFSIIDDAFFETTETFSVNLARIAPTTTTLVKTLGTDPALRIVTTTQQLAIGDDEYANGILIGFEGHSAHPTTVREEQSTEVTWILKLSKVNQTHDNLDITLDFSTMSAQFAVDFASTTQISIEPGQNTASLNVTLMDDRLLESTEHSLITILSVSRGGQVLHRVLPVSVPAVHSTAVIGAAILADANTQGIRSSTAALHIDDDEYRQGVQLVWISTPSVTEGRVPAFDVEFYLASNSSRTIRITNDTSQPIDVNLRLHADSSNSQFALPIADYQFAETTATERVFAVDKGHSSFVVSFSINDDNVLEKTEQADIVVDSSNSVFNGLPSTLSLAILDDEVAEATLVGVDGLEGSRNISAQVRLSAVNGTGSTLTFGLIISTSGTLTLQGDEADLDSTLTTHTTINVTIRPNRSIGEYRLPNSRDDLLLETPEYLEATLHYDETLSGNITSSRIKVNSDGVRLTLNDDESRAGIVARIDQHQAGLESLNSVGIDGRDLVVEVGLFNDAGMRITNAIGSPISFILKRSRLSPGSARFSGIGTDYLMSNAGQTVIIENHQTTDTETIQIVGDERLEGTETIGLILENSLASIRVSTQAFFAEILDDEATTAAVKVTVSIAEAILEDSVGSDVRIELSNTNGTGMPLSFTIDDAEGVAKASSPTNDFMLPGGTNPGFITIPIGQVFGVNPLQIMDDNKLEGDEQMLLRIQSASSTFRHVFDFEQGAIIASTILDDELLNANITLRLVPMQEGYEVLPNTTGTQDIQFKVELYSNGELVVNETQANINFTLNYAGSAIGANQLSNQVDYQKQIVGTILNGQSSTVITLKVNDDEHIESTETVIVSLVADNALFSPENSLSIPIFDNEQLSDIRAQLQIRQNAIEGNTPAQIAVVLDDVNPRELAKDLQIQLTLSPSADRPASINEDLRVDSRLLEAIILPGQSEALISIDTQDNDRLDGDRNFDVRITRLAFVSKDSSETTEIETFDASTVTVLISDNERPEVRLIPKNDGEEANANEPIVFDVIMDTTNQSGVDLEFPMSFDGSLAQLGSDFHNVNQSSSNVSAKVVIANNSKAAQISLWVVDDLLYEYDESIIVRLQEPEDQNIQFTLPKAEVKIIDNDESASAIPFAYIQAIDNTQEGSGPIRFRLVFARSLGGSASEPKTVTLMAAGEVNGFDFDANRLDLDFNAYGHLTELDLAIRDDELFEGDERFTLSFSSRQLSIDGQTFQTDQHTAEQGAPFTIEDNDTNTLTIAIADVQNEGSVVDIQATLAKRYDGAKPLWIPVTMVGVSTHDYTATVPADFNDHNTVLLQFTTSSRIVGGRMVADVVYEDGSAAIIRDDGLFETTETASISVDSLRNPALSLAGQLRKVVEIVDNNPQPRLMVTQITTGTENLDQPLVFELSTTPTNHTGQDILFTISAHYRRQQPSLGGAWTRLCA